MSKFLSLLVELLKAFQHAQAERDPMAGKTTKRADPPTRRVEQGVKVSYSPDMDGDADPGEVVWAWVPFTDDPNRGKDRPVVVIGRTVGDSRSMLAGVPLTSRHKNRSDHVPVGTGAWDPKGRDSWAKVDQLLMLPAGDIRREGAALAKNRFDDVVGNLAKYHELIRS